MAYVPDEFGSAYSVAAANQMQYGSPSRALGGTSLSTNGGTSAANPWIGPVSQGLSMVSGLAEAMNLFSGSKKYKDSAKQLRLQAGQAFEQGVETGRDIQHEGEEVKGEMMAAFGKSGTLLEGSPLLALADTTREIERNVGRAIEQGRIEQQALLYQARQADKAAQSGMLGGIVKIGGVVAAPFTGGASLGLTAAQWG
jgi:hypothetical protein